LACRGANGVGGVGATVMVIASKCWESEGFVIIVVLYKIEGLLFHVGGKY